MYEFVVGFLKSHGISKVIFKCITNNARGVLNIASGKTYSFKQLAELVMTVCKSNSQIIKQKRIGPMPHNGYRPFNIHVLKKNFYDIQFNNVRVALIKYYIKLKNYENRSN